MKTKDNNKGTVMVLALIATIILMILGFAYIYIFQEEMMFFIRHRNRSEAFNAAEAGLARAQAWLVNLYGYGKVSPTPEWYAEQILGVSAGDTFSPFIGDAGETDGEWNTIEGSESSYKVSITPHPSNPGSLQRYYVISSTGLSPAALGDYYKPLKAGVTLYMKNVVGTGQIDTGLANIPDGADENYIDPPQPYLHSFQTELKVIDYGTSLMWPERWETAISLSQSNAVAESGALTDYLGFSDWRLPNVKELTSIINYGQLNPALASEFYGDTSSPRRWTATTGGSGGYYVDITDGSIGHMVETSSIPYVPVRDVLTDTDMLFYARAGGPAPGFSDNGDGTITDNRTGLMWVRDLEPGSDFPQLTLSWEDAVDLCNELNYAGFFDWRLPDKKELLSIVNYQNLSSPLDYTDFEDIEAASYWTSTTYIPDPTRAWSVDFSDGTSSGEAKGLSRYFRPVRGPHVEVDYWEEGPFEIK